MRKYLLLTFVILLSSCASNPDGSNAQLQVQQSNLEWEKKRSPLRSQYTEFEDGSSVLSFVWAGLPGDSIAMRSDVLLDDIITGLRSQCGYQPKDLLETRIVKHEHPVYYEVWVFKDENSNREDRTSGVTVYLEALPDGGGTDINYYGNCETE